MGDTISIAGGRLPETEETLKEFLPKASTVELSTLTDRYKNDLDYINRNISQVDTLRQNSSQLREKILQKAKTGDPDANSDLASFDRVVGPSIEGMSSQLHQRLDLVTSYRDLVNKELDRGWGSKAAIEVGKVGGYLLAPWMGDVTGLLSRRSFSDPRISGAGEKAVEQSSKFLGPFSTEAFKNVSGESSDTGGMARRFVMEGGLFGNVRDVFGAYSGKAFGPDRESLNKEGSTGIEGSPAISAGKLTGNIVGLVGTGGTGALGKLPWYTKTLMAAGATYGATRPAEDTFQRLENTLNFTLLGHLGGGGIQGTIKTGRELGQKFNLLKLTSEVKPTVPVDIADGAVTNVPALEKMKAEYGEKINARVSDRKTEIAGALKTSPTPIETIVDAKKATGEKYSADAIWHTLYDPEVGSPELAAKLDPEAKNIPKWYTEEQVATARRNAEIHKDVKLKDLVKERSLDAATAQADLSFYKDVENTAPSETIRSQVPGTHENQVASSMLGDAKAQDLPNSPPLYRSGTTQKVHPGIDSGASYPFKITKVSPVNGQWVYEGLDFEGREISVPEKNIIEQRPVQLGDTGTIRFTYGVGQDAVKEARVTDVQIKDTKNGPIKILTVEYKKSANARTLKTTQIPESQFTISDISKKIEATAQKLNEEINKNTPLAQELNKQFVISQAEEAAQEGSGTLRKEAAAASQEGQPTQTSTPPETPVSTPQDASGGRQAPEPVPGVTPSTPQETPKVSVIQKALEEIYKNEPKQIENVRSMSPQEQEFELDLLVQENRIPLDVRDRLVMENEKLLKEGIAREEVANSVGSKGTEKLQASELMKETEAGSMQSGEKKSVGKQSKSKVAVSRAAQKKQAISDLGFTEDTPVKASWLASPTGQEYWNKIQELGLRGDDPAFLQKYDPVRIKIATKQQAAERMTGLLMSALGEFDKSQAEFYAREPKMAGSVIDVVKFLRFVKEKGLEPTVEDIARFLNDGRARPTKKITNAFDIVSGKSGSVTLNADITGGLAVNVYNGATRLFRSVFNQAASQQRLDRNLPKLGEIIDVSVEHIRSAVSGQVGRRLTDADKEFLTVLRNNAQSNDLALQEATAAYIKEFYGTDKIENPWTWAAGNKMLKLRSYPGLVPIVDALNDAVINRSAFVTPLRAKIGSVLSALPEDARTRVLLAANDNRINDLPNLREQSVALLIRDTLDKVVGMFNDVAPSLGKDRITIQDNYIPHIFDRVSKESWRSADDKRAFEIFNQFEKFRSGKEGFSTDVVKTFDTYLKVVFDDLLFSTPLEMHKNLRPVMGQGTGAMLDHVVDLATGKWRSAVDKFVYDKVIQGTAEGAMKRSTNAYNLPSGSPERQKALEFSRTFGLNTKNAAEDMTNALVSWEYLTTLGLRASSAMLNMSQTAFTMMDVKPWNYAKALGETFAAGHGLSGVGTIVGGVSGFSQGDTTLEKLEYGALGAVAGYGAGKLASRGIQKALPTLAEQHDNLMTQILPNLNDPVEGIEKSNLIAMHDILRHVMDSPIGLGGISAVDRMNKRIAALAGYYQGLESGMSHSQAIDLARNTVERTGLLYTSMNRPGYIQQAGKAGRPLMTFMDTPTRQLDRHMIAWGEFKRALANGDKATAAEIGGRYLTGVGSMIGVYYLLSGMGLKYNPGQVGLTPVEVAAQIKDGIEKGEAPSLNRFIRGPGWNLIDATGSALSQDPASRPYAEALEQNFLPWYIQSFKDYVDIPEWNHKAEKIQDLGNGPVFMSRDTKNSGVAADAKSSALKAAGFRLATVEDSREKSSNLRDQGEQVSKIRVENLRRIRESLLTKHQIDEDAWKTLVEKGDYKNGDELNQAIHDTLLNAMKPEFRRQLESLPPRTRTRLLEEGNN